VYPGLVRALLGVVLCLASCSNGDAGGAGGAGDAGDVPEAGVAFVVVSADGLPSVPPPAASCPVEGDVESRCDHLIPLNCDQQGQRIGFDPDDDTPCPICVMPSASDPATCEQWQRRYLEFLADNISQACINSCTRADVCTPIAITNSCGTVGVALSGLLDEEPIEFAREFARTNCAPACGFVEQTLDDAAVLAGYQVRCLEAQCVFVAKDPRDAGPVASDAAP
jgi:hypothetical protein